VCKESLGSRDFEVSWRIRVEREFNLNFFVLLCRVVENKVGVVGI